MTLKQAKVINHTAADAWWLPRRYADQPEDSSDYCTVITDLTQFKLSVLPHTRALNNCCVYDKEVPESGDLNQSQSRRFICKATLTLRLRLYRGK